MQNALETVYGLGRLAFGLGLMTAPRQVGEMLVGDEARRPAVRIGMRTYGTRDVVLGFGTLRAVVEGRDTRSWLLAGVASDVLDTGVQVAEWSDLPPEKRLPGVALALGAAGAGLALLARR